MPYCERCDRHFKKKQDLKQHRANSSQHFVCHDCDKPKEFATKQALVQHRIDTATHAYCQHCDIVLGNGMELEQHYMRGHIFCPSCRTFFDSDGALGAHDCQKCWYCVECMRLFQSESNLNTHMRSSATHNARTRMCPKRGCNKLFISYADLVLHLESGGCRSKVKRSTINALVVKIDSGQFITNPDRLLTGPDGAAMAPSVVQTYATELSFNGTAYECILCHRTFATLPRLNEHLGSPAHEDKIYRCPAQVGGCETEFQTLSGLIQHAESQSCDIHHSQKQMNSVLDDLSTKFGGIGIV